MSFMRCRILVVRSEALRPCNFIIYIIEDWRWLYVYLKGVKFNWRELSVVIVNVEKAMCSARAIAFSARSEGQKFWIGLKQNLPSIYRSLKYIDIYTQQQDVDNHL